MPRSSHCWDPESFQPRPLSETLAGPQCTRSQARAFTVAEITSLAHPCHSVSAVVCRPPDARRSLPNRALVPVTAQAGRRSFSRAVPCWGPAAAAPCHLPSPACGARDISLSLPKTELWRQGTSGALHTARRTLSLLLLFDLASGLRCPLTSRVRVLSLGIHLSCLELLWPLYPFVR